MPFEISKTFEFSASHQLDHLAEDHPCRRLHGHNYVVQVFLRSGMLDERGFVRDYGELKPFKEYLDQHFDHRHLNDVIDCPTAELLALHFYTWLRPRYPELYKVGVSETGKTWAWYWVER